MTKETEGRRSANKLQERRTTLVHLSLSTVILGVAYLVGQKIEADNRTEYSQVPMDCKTYSESHRMEESQRLKYKSTYSCPLEFFEYYSFLYQNQLPSPPAGPSRSYVLMALSVDDQTGLYEGKTLKIFLTGSIYISPRGTSKPLHAVSVMDRPVYFNHSKTKAVKNFRGKTISLSDLTVLNRIELGLGLDYEAKVRFTAVDSEDRETKRIDPIADSRFLMSVYLIRVDEWRNEEGEQLLLIAKTAICMGAIALCAYQLLGTRGKLVTSLGLSLFRFFCLAVILFFNPITHNFTRSRSLSHSHQIKELQLILYKACISSGLALGVSGVLASPSRVLDLLADPAANYAASTKRAIKAAILVGLGYFLVSMGANQDLMLNDDPHMKDRTIRIRIFYLLDKGLNLLRVLTVVVLLLTHLRTWWRLKKLPGRMSLSLLSLASALACLCTDWVAWTFYTPASLELFRTAAIGSVLVAAPFLANYYFTHERQQPAAVSRDEEATTLMSN